MPIISLQGLSKRYGRLQAVAGLNLEVEDGEIFGFLGLNGSGKTTTIRILLDLLRPTSGHASIFGLDCQRDGLAVRARVGYLPGEMGLYRDMTGADTLDFFAHLGGVVDRALQQRLLDRLELASADLRRKLREYSTGMKRKLGIVQAFQNDPQLLILDEPTEGLDPLMQAAFYSLLQETRSRGRTIFMSSHVLSEVERVCDRVALIRQGRLMVEATVEKLRHLAPRRVTVTFDADVAPPALTAGLIGTSIESIAPRRWTLLVTGPMGAVTAMLGGLPVADLQIQEPSLDDALREYYRAPK